MTTDTIPRIQINQAREAGSGEKSGVYIGVHVGHDDDNKVQWLFARPDGSVEDLGNTQ